MGCKPGPSQRTAKRWDAIVNILKENREGLRPREIVRKLTWEGIIPGSIQYDLSGLVSQDRITRHTTDETARNNKYVYFPK